MSVGTRTARGAGPSGIALWVLGARPKTLGISIAGVVLGIASAGHAVPWPTAAAFVVALALQVGVNYLNDYSDGVRGMDTVGRVGPVRLVGSGLASPAAVRRAAFLSLALAAAVGTALALTTAPWLLLLGVACVVAAALYSGGPRPYAALGLGEVAVFLFFGPAVVCGTAYVEFHRVPASAGWAAVTSGCCAAAVLLLNNLRDRASDADRGKRTLAVRLGDRPARVLVAVLLATSVGVVLPAVASGAYSARALAALVAVPFVASMASRVREATGGELVDLLVGAVRFQLLLALGLALLIWPW